MLKRAIIAAALGLALAVPSHVASGQVACPPGGSGVPIPIPCLPNGAAPSGTEVVPAYQNSREVKLTTAQIMQAAAQQIASTPNVIGAATAANLMANFGGM